VFGFNGDAAKPRLLSLGAASVASVLAVEPKGLDQLRHRRGHEAVDRLSARHAVANVSRRDRERLDLEELHPLGLRELSQHIVETLSWKAGPGRHSDARAGEVATRGPKTIAVDDLAAKALEVMEAWAITSLVAVDDSGRPAGVIHMHDILRAKIV